MFKNEKKILELLKEDHGKVDFVFKEIAIYFNEINQTIRVLRNKATMLIGFLFAVVAFSVPEFIRNIYSEANDEVLVSVYYGYFLFYISIVYCLIAAWLSYKTFKTITLDIAGAEPKKIIDGDYIQHNLNIIKISECKQYQKKIDNNFKLMQGISKAFNDSIHATILTAVIGLLTLLWFITSI